MSDLPPEVIKARAHVLSWLSQERSRYADADKYKEGNPGRDIVRESLSDGDFGEEAMNFLLSYIKRAELYGLGTPQGRQALGKAIVTATHFLETVCEYFGSMPEPGHSSGKIEPWRDCPVPLAGGPNVG